MEGTKSDPILISAIIPTLNEEGILGESLEKLLAQSIPPDEIIIADGGSHDKTVEIASRYEKVKVLSLPASNIAEARNEAVRASEGVLILSLDADTILCDGWIEKVIDHFLDPDVVAVGSRTAPRTPSMMNNFFSKMDNIPKVGLGNSTMFRKDVLPFGEWYRNRGWMGIYEDGVLWKDLRSRGKVIYDQDVVAYIRVPTMGWKCIMKGVTAFSLVSCSLLTYSKVRKKLIST